MSVAPPNDPANTAARAAPDERRTADERAAADERTAPRVCLASASPRRRALLDQIGVAHRVLPAHIDESQHCGESARDYVERMARSKALAVLPQAAALPVLAADTVVVLEGAAHGKPRDRAHGLAMLAALSGHTHEVLTAVAIARVGHPVRSRLSVSRVHMRVISESERAAYWDSGEPHDKAGAYAIQGLGAVFIEWLQGSYSGVMGLPLYETAKLLAHCGVPCWMSLELAPRRQGT